MPLCQGLGHRRNNYEAAQEVFSRALDIARREQDEALEMRILAGATEPDVRFLRLQGALAKSLRALELAQDADNPRTEVNARHNCGAAQYMMADLKGARQQAAAMLGPAEHLRDRYLLAHSVVSAWVAKLMSITEAGWPSAAARLTRRPLPST